MVFFWDFKLKFVIWVLIWRCHFIQSTTSKSEISMEMRDAFVFGGWPSTMKRLLFERFRWTKSLFRLKSTIFKLVDLNDPNFYTFYFIVLSVVDFDGSI